MWPCTSTHHLSGVPGIQVCLLVNAFRALDVVGPTCDPGSPSEEEVPGVTSWRSGLTPSFLLWCSRHTPSPSSPSSSSTASRSSRVRASSAGHYSGGLGFWGWWWFGRARLSSERELACPATLPQIPIPACLVCLVIVNSKHSRPPLFVTWWPKWPEPAVATSGASGCSGGLEKRAPARPPAACRMFRRSSPSTSTPRS